MTSGSISEAIIQVAETGMLALFAIEVLARTLMLTVTEVRKAWTAMRDDTRERPKTGA